MLIITMIIFLYLLPALFSYLWMRNQYLMVWTKINPTERDLFVVFAPMFNLAGAIMFMFELLSGDMFDSNATIRKGEDVNGLVKFFNLHVK